MLGHAAVAEIVELELIARQGAALLVVGQIARGLIAMHERHAVLARDALDRLHDVTVIVVRGETGGVLRIDQDDIDLVGLKPLERFVERIRKRLNSPLTKS